MQIKELNASDGKPFDYSWKPRTEAGAALRLARERVFQQLRAAIEVAKIRG